MTKYEINQKIFRLEQNITSTEIRIADAETNIRQLMALKNSCNEYQMELESSRTMRNTKMEHGYMITGQAVLVGAYGGVLDEILGGTEYKAAYNNMDTARSDIEQEIERQIWIINECKTEILTLNSNISTWRQQLLNSE